MKTNSELLKALDDSMDLLYKDGLANGDLGYAFRHKQIILIMELIAEMNKPLVLDGRDLTSDTWVDRQGGSFTADELADTGWH